jgi:hypothetical protein
MLCIAIAIGASQDVFCVSKIGEGNLTGERGIEVKTSYALIETILYGEVV